ncbi:hypothetical protein [Gelidibacter sp.]|uniref:hypothetical protein n=1 Tax=Gelidibacter sp. TaxID=2018083 RepID=UPI0039C8685C
MIHQINNGVGMTKYAVFEENTKGKYRTNLHKHFHCTVCTKTISLLNKIWRN